MSARLNLKPTGAAAEVSLPASFDSVLAGFARAATAPLIREANRITAELRAQLGQSGLSAEGGEAVALAVLEQLTPAARERVLQRAGGGR